MIADRGTYLEELWANLMKAWPENATANIVCHGHSVPAGYFMTPVVNGLYAYPHLLRVAIAERFPFSVVNVIVTAVGGENAEQGARRFDRDVMCVRPRVVTVDYSLNDRAIGLDAAQAAWRRMIERALDGGSKVILLTPSWEQSYAARGEDWALLNRHVESVRRLAEEYEIGLSDSFAAFERHVSSGGALCELLSQSNHPNKLGHALIARELARWFLP